MRLATTWRGPTPARMEEEGHRGAIEAIVVAMILALAGSRVRGRGLRHPDRFDGRPTLMGRHEEVACPSASSSTRSMPPARRGGRLLNLGGFRFRPECRRSSRSSRRQGTCVNCRYRADLQPASRRSAATHPCHEVQLRHAFLPGSSVPGAQDVNAVFRYPEEPEVGIHQAARGLAG